MNPRSQSRKHARGVTLIEMVIVLVIIAVLAAVALPNFRESMQSSRISSMNHEFISSVNLVRSEAIKANRGAVMCASTDGNACNAGVWNDGWIVWVDQNANGVRDINDTVVRHQQALNRVTLTVAGGTPQLRFNARGILVGVPPTFTLMPVDCKPGRENQRTMTVLVSGSIRTSKGACP